MRKRFHRFQHRALVQALAHKAQEMGARMLEAYARGTSRWAYDGSGKVTRSKENAQLATFDSGKKYNADLNGALNIAARGLAMLLGIKPSTEQSSNPRKRQRSPALKRPDFSGAGMGEPSNTPKSGYPKKKGPIEQIDVGLWGVVVALLVQMYLSHAAIQSHASAPPVW